MGIPNGMLDYSTSANAFASALLANMALIFFNSCDKTYGLITTDY